MGYSNETNVANEMKDSRRAVKVQTMLAAPLPSEDGQIYRVHILRNETPSNCPSQVGPFSLCKASSICYILSVQVTEVEDPHFSMYNGQRESSSDLKSIRLTKCSSFSRQWPSPFPSSDAS